MPGKKTLRPRFFAIVALAAVALTGHGSAPATANDCLAPEEVQDADVAANVAALRDDTALCLTVTRFEENDATWRLTVVRNKERPGPLWAVPHDEEDVAFGGGVYAVARYGGVLVAVENDERRRVDGLDPNQIFATSQAAVDVCAGTNAVAPTYVRAFLDLWDRRYPVVGLHSNWDGHAGAGGLGTISVRRPDKKMIPFPSEVGTGRLADEDTILMLVSTRDPGENSAGQQAIAWFNNHGIHVIYRHVTEENDGCTLADYLTLNRLGPYFNIEVEHGDTGTQPEMIDLLMDYVGSPAFRGML